MRLKFIGFVTLSFVVLFSCKQDVEPVMAESIQGKWLIDEAFRNNRKTGLLKNGFFHITDTTFTTNIIPGGERTFNYSYLNNKLRLSDEEASTYDIVSLSQDTLRLNTSIGHFDFKFITVKEKTE